MCPGPAYPPCLNPLVHWRATHWSHPSFYLFLLKIFSISVPKRTSWAVAQRCVRRPWISRVSIRFPTVAGSPKPWHRPRMLDAGHWWLIIYYYSYIRTHIHTVGGDECGWNVSKRFGVDVVAQRGRGRGQEEEVGEDVCILHNTRITNEFSNGEAGEDEKTLHQWCPTVWSSGD